MSRLRRLLGSVFANSLFINSIEGKTTTPSMELINMRRTASEVLHELEMRIARLERYASQHERFSDEMWADELEADEMFAGRTWDGKGDQKNYNKPPAPKNQPDCYSDDNWEGVGKPGEGETCYRLHNPYGSGVSKNKKEYNKRYREEWMDSPSIKRAPEERPGRR